MAIFINIIWLLLAYLIGSIPWALLIGKVFYHKDVRNFGSGNLGGTNALRVLGVLPGVIVMILDASKAFIIMTLAYYLKLDNLKYIGLFVCIGHCFPIFANFKGGKAVACACGYVLALCLYITHEVFLGFIIPMLVWLVVLLISDYMSLASLSGIVVAAIMAFITSNDQSLGLLVSLLAIFVIYRHKTNIIKLIHGEERKMHILKK